MSQASHRRLGFPPSCADNPSEDVAPFLYRRRFEPLRVVTISVVAHRSVTVGVSHNPDAISEVTGANGSRWNAIPFRIEPERGQIPENVSKTPSKQTWDVLHEHEAGS